MNRIQVRVAVHVECDHSKGDCERETRGVSHDELGVMVSGPEVSVRLGLASFVSALQDDFPHLLQPLLLSKSRLSSIISSYLSHPAPCCALAFRVIRHCSLQSRLTTTAHHTSGERSSIPTTNNYSVYKTCTRDRLYLSTSHRVAATAVTC